MNYLDSPTRRSDINNTSPLTLFDSPSRSGNRYNYQALSCESPPANFEDLRTPMQVPRPSLDWTRAITTTSTLGRSIFSSNYNRSSPITTNENRDVEKIQPPQQEQKIVSSPIKEKNSSLIKSTLKSPLGNNEKWDTLNEEDDENKEEKNLMTLDASPINSSLPKIDYKIAHSTPVRQEFQYIPSSDNSSPIKFSPLIRKDYDKNSPTDISQKLHYTLEDDNNKDHTSKKSMTNSLDGSPIKKYDIKHDFSDDKGDKKRNLSYGKAKSDTDNDSEGVKDNENNKSDKKEDESLSFLYKSYSERLVTSTPKTYSRHPFTFSNPNKQEKENDDKREYIISSSSTPPPTSPQKQQIPSTYRSPVYSNSSYKNSDKKQSPVITPQKTANNNIDDTIKQSSIIKSPLKSDNTGNISNISLLSPSYSTTQYISHVDIKNNYSNYDNGHDNENNNNNIYGNNSYNDNEKHQQQKETTALSPKSPLAIAATLKKDQQHEEINTQTSSHGSNISKSSSKRRYKYINTELPHYMRSTESFQNRIQSSENSTKLHKTISGGIAKRSSSNSTRFKSTTKINAIDDIRNEMTPEDVYIPLAARVKLFEKGLGNGIKPTPINSQKQPNITSFPGTHRLTKPKSPQLLTRQRSFSSSHNCYRTDERSSVPQSPSVLENESSAKNIKHTNQRKHTEDQTYTINRDNSNNNSHRVNKRPYYSISSSSISTNKNDHHAKKGENKKQRRHDHPPLEVKPFQFATDKRAARYQELFRTKLKLWKEKENQEKPVPKRHK